MVSDNKKSKSFINDKGLVPKTTLTIGVDEPVAKKAKNFIARNVKTKEELDQLLDILGIPSDL